MSKQFWNDRYSSVDSVYGNEPNEFFKLQLKNLVPGTLLLPGEGEGRNALYAAKNGWNVFAFDFSEEGQRKALQKAKAHGLTIHYSLEDIQQVQLPAEQFDAIALIYIHLPHQLRKVFHAQCVNALKPGGTLIMEIFSTHQLAYNSGGPKDPQLLYSVDELAEDFNTLNVSVFLEEIIHLNEDAFHQGPASVIRLVATK